jgi:hypothetical protein
VLSGTPTEWGWFRIKVTASNGVAPDAVKSLWLKVRPQDHECHGKHGFRGKWFWVSIHHHRYKHAVWSWAHCSGHPDHDHDDD